MVRVGGMYNGMLKVMTMSSILMLIMMLMPINIFVESLSIISFIDDIVDVDADVVAMDNLGCC